MFMGACESVRLKLTKQISLLCCGCSFLEPFSVLRVTVFSVLLPPPLQFNHSCNKPASLHPSLCPLYPKTMCGMSFQFPPRWRRAPNKTKQLYLSSLGPGLHPLSLSNSPLSPTGLSLHSLPSVAVSVTISWAEGLLSASVVEHLAGFSLHVSFKGLSRSRHTCPRHKEEREVLRREMWREGRRAELEQRMMACSGASLVLMWWRGRGMDGLAVGGRTGFTVPALNYFNWSH